MKLKGKTIGWIVACAAVIVGAGMIAYDLTGGNQYRQIFYQGTMLNGVDVSGLTVDEAKQKLIEVSKDYALRVNFKTGAVDIGSELLNLSYNDEADIAAAKRHQNRKKKRNTPSEELVLTVEDLFIYDTTAVTEKLEACTAMNPEQMEAPKNASLVYNAAQHSFSLKEGITGTTLDEKRVLTAVGEAINSLQSTVNVESLDLYEKAELTASSENAADILSEADSYLLTQLTYTFNDGTSEVINGDMIATWLYIDDALTVQVDQDEVQSLVNTYVESHASGNIGTSFKTTDGDTIRISVPVSGEAIDANALYADMMQSLTQKSNETRNIPYSSDVMDANNNFNGSYVEVDLEHQVLYVYKAGRRVMASDIVSGSVSAGHWTPVGVFKIYSMETDVTLRGVGYASPVSYWMPFNGGIGFHDATWRSNFGSSIYLHNGSHGCINMPANKAKILYNTINTGYYVVVYGGETSVGSGSISGSSHSSGNSKNDKKKTEKKEEETLAPESNTTETNTSETSAPETNAPETSKPETSAPETSAPETSAPETSAPETSKPETSAPETSKPETSKPETSKPDNSASEQRIETQSAGE